MKPARLPVQRAADAKLLVIDPSGAIHHAARSDLVDFLSPGDLLVANDAATLPASLKGTHRRTGQPIEVRLAGRNSLAPGQVNEFTAIVFGAGDFRTRTEDRAFAPQMNSGDELALGPLRATVTRVAPDTPRLIDLHLHGEADVIWAGIANHGRPIQYAHLAQPLALWDVWTKLAALPVAFEAPSAGFMLDWKLLDALRRARVDFATLTHAAGISSTGDAALDARLPFDEAYRLPTATVEAINRTRGPGTAVGQAGGRSREAGKPGRAAGGRVIALGTTVARALEHAASLPGGLRAGNGLADQKIGPHTRLAVVDAILSGTHEAGTSHYDLLRAFTGEQVLRAADAQLEERGYLTHEFGDSVLIYRQNSVRDEKASHRSKRRRLRARTPVEVVLHA